VTRQPSPFLALAPAVERALIRGQPVVALESSLIAHGFPAGEGAAVARDAEAAVRAAGAVPATVAVVDGTVQVGIAEDAIDRLAHDPGVRKVGPRDLAPCAISGRWGATTVAGTLATCRIAGIHFMGTGGIGGVHRGWTATLDVSADLYELAQAPVCVICSGAKSMLDVAATLELLETFAVPVIGYGTDYLPLFLERASEHRVADRADDPGTIATVAAAHWGFARNTGVVVAQPVAEDVALAPGELEPLVADALAEAARAGVRGGAVTPFVLVRMHEATGGRSLAANRRLVVDNAALAAQVAVAYYAV
jgi:pseudouridylate synthase